MGMRIPMAILLGSTVLGLNGVWWSISLSSMFKGVILVTLFILYMKRFSKKYGIAGENNFGQDK